jgi:hypothetical protein
MLPSPASYEISQTHKFQKTVAMPSQQLTTINSKVKLETMEELKKKQIGLTEPTSPRY